MRKLWKKELLYQWCLRSLGIACGTLVLLIAAILPTAYRQPVPVYAENAAGEADVTDFVSRLYTVILERTPDEAGLAEWTGYLQNGTFTGAEVAKGFIMSEEFLGKEMTNEEFVQILYQAFFGREADTNGLETWTNFLNEGYRKSFVFAGFANSGEFAALCEDYGVAAGFVPVTVSEQQPNLSEEEYNTWLFVERMYTEVLNRTPDMGGLAEWADYLQDGTFTGAEVAEGFILSEEFLSKDMEREEYVQLLYRAFFGREGTVKEYWNWVVLLGKEYSKRYVFAGFANSNEFGALCESYGITRGEIEIRDIELEVPEITAMYEDPKGIRLEWNAVEGATGYAIYMQNEYEDGTIYWNRAGAVEGGDTLTWTSDWTSGNSMHGEYVYTFAIRALGSDIPHTPDSSEEGQKILGLPKKPVVALPYGTRSLGIWWEDVGGHDDVANDFAEGYEVKILKDAEEYGTYTNYYTCEETDIGDYYELAIYFEEAMEGEFAVQIRCYKTLPDVGVVYSPWSEEVEIVTHAEMEAQIDQILEEILADAETDFEKAIAIYEWVVNNTYYDFGVGRENQYLENVILNGYAVCGGYADSFKGLAEKAGLEVKYIAGYPEEGAGHGWNQVKITGQWYNLDATWGDNVQKETLSEIFLRTYGQFLISNETLDQDHGEYCYGRANEEECPEDYDREEIYRYLWERIGSDNSFFASSPEELELKFAQKLSEEHNVIEVWYYCEDISEDIWEEIEVREILDGLDAGYPECRVAVADMKWLVNNLYKAEIHIYQYVDGSNGIEAIIPEGITRIADSAFEGRSDLVGVDIPDTVIYVGDGAFSGCSGLTEIALPEGVTYLGASAFTGCSGLTELTIPEGVKEIGNSAFSYCTGLTEFKLPEGVESLGIGLFTGCSNLVSVDLPEDVTTISEWFRGCSKLSSIEIPKGVTEIRGGSFADCTNLTSVVLSDGIILIGENAFDGCTNLQSVNIPEGVTTIGTKAFYDCTSLQVLALPDSVTSIGEYAFYNCSGLTSISIPDSVTSIGEYAFYNCSGLSELTLSEEITELGAFAFSGCNGLTKINIPAGITVLEKAVFSGCSGLTALELPEGITTIENSAFSGCSGLTKLILPDGATTIESAAFSGCSGLTKLTLPEGITSIGDNTFFGCSSLTELTLPEEVTTIGKYAFMNCTSLTKLSLPESVTSIGTSAFYGCSSMEEINISGDVTALDTNMFVGCSALKKITLSGNVTTIGKAVFSGCSSLTELELPDSITTIGTSAFSGCSSLTELSLPEGITSIGEFAFSGCSGLESVTLPTNITVIERYLFEDCSSLAKIDIPEGVTTIKEGAFSNCSSLAGLSIPESVTAIKDSAFRDCSSLVELKLPEGITTIGEYAFRGCGIVELNIPAGVTSLANFAFYGCSSLVDLTIAEGVTTIGSAAFASCSSLKNVELPEGITTIDINAFAFCDSLEEIAIPEGVTTLGKGAFYDCGSLATVSIPEGVTTIGADAFGNCKSLKSIALPESIFTIGDAAFVNCTSLEEIDIPKCYILGTSVFSGCTSLKSIELPVGTTSLKNRVFADSGLESFTIPEGVKTIGEYAFEGCTALSTITFSSTVITIEQYAFDGCTGLTNVELSDSITSIKAYAFRKCSSLKELAIPDSVESMSWSTFTSCYNLTIHCSSGSYAESFAINNSIPYVTE